MTGLRERRAELQRATDMVRSFAITSPLTKFAFGQETTFEAAFANLADSYLADKAPMLTKYKIGFQLLEKNEDNTRAAGISGFKVGDRWIFVPVLFLNGELKGHDIFYLRDEDRFLPLDDKWVGEVLQDDSKVFDRGSPRREHMRGVPAPDLNVFKDSPLRRGSYGSSKYANLRPGFEEAVGGFYKASMTPRPENPTDLVSFLKEAGSQALETFVDWRNNLPDVRAACDRFYPGVDFSSLREHYHKQASSEFLRPNLLPEPILRVDTVRTLDDKISDPAGVLRNRFSDIRVFDKRAAENLNSIFEINSERAFTNPSETGIYDVLVNRGEVQRCVVLMNPVTTKGARDSCLVMPTGGKKCFVLADPARVYARVGATNSETSGMNRSEFKKWWEGLASSDGKVSLPTASGLPDDDTTEKAEEEANKALAKKEDPESERANNAAREDKADERDKKKYVLIGPKGDSVGPFLVKYDAGGDQYHNLEVSFDEWKKYKSPYVGREPDPQGHDEGCPESITLTGQDGFLTVSGSGVYVPNGFKKLDVGKYADPRDFRLGAEAELWDTVFRNDLKLETKKEAGQYQIREGTNVLFQAPTQAGVWKYLIEEHCLSEKQARDIEFGKKYLIRKTANDLLRRLDVTTPGFPDPITGSSFSGGHVQEQYYQEQESPIQMPQGAEILPHLQPDPMALQMANTAQQTGVKELFDASMMGSILRAVKDESLVDKNLRTILNTIDGLGRIRLGMYWHQEKFEDRYGKQDMPELEDQLKSNFHSLGDLYLFLKTRDIDPIMFNFGPDLRPTQ